MPCELLRNKFLCSGCITRKKERKKERTPLCRSAMKKGLDVFEE
jgi:hypothetical protein